MKTRFSYGPIRELIRSATSRGLPFVVCDVYMARRQRRHMAVTGPGAQESYDTHLLRALERLAVEGYQSVVLVTELDTGHGSAIELQLVNSSPAGN